MGDRALTTCVLLLFLDYYFGIVDRSCISGLRFFGTTLWRRCRLLFFLCFAYFLDELSFEIWVSEVLKEARPVNLRQPHILDAQDSMRPEELFFLEISRVFSSQLLCLQLGKIKDGGGVLTKEIDIQCFVAVLLEPVLQWLVIKQ